MLFEFVICFLLMTNDENYKWIVKNYTKKIINLVSRRSTLSPTKALNSGRRTQNQSIMEFLCFIYFIWACSSASKSVAYQIKNFLRFGRILFTYLLKKWSHTCCNCLAKILYQIIVYKINSAAPWHQISFCLHLKVCVFWFEY